MKWLLAKLVLRKEGGLRVAPFAALLGGLLALLVADSPFGRDVAQEFCGSLSSKAPVSAPASSPSISAPAVE